MTKAELAIQQGIDTVTHIRELYSEGLVLRFYDDGSINFSHKEDVWLSFSNEEEFGIFCQDDDLQPEVLK